MKLRIRRHKGLGQVDTVILAGVIEECTTEPTAFFNDFAESVNNDEEYIVSFVWEMAPSEEAKPLADKIARAYELMQQQAKISEEFERLKAEVFAELETKGVNRTIVPAEPTPIFMGFNDVHYEPSLDVDKLRAKLTPEQWTKVSDAPVPVRTLNQQKLAEEIKKGKLDQSVITENMTEARTVRRRMGPRPASAQEIAQWQQ